MDDAEIPALRLPDRSLPRVTAFLFGMIVPLGWVFPQIIIVRLGDVDPRIAVPIFDWSKWISILLGAGFLGVRAMQLRKGRGSFAREGAAWLFGVFCGIGIDIVGIVVSFSRVLQS